MTFLRRYGWIAALVLLTALYLSTLQTIPNGSSDAFMIDVGETQIVLNRWGTLHATGYPLYVIVGNLLTAAMRVLTVSPVATPGLVSLLWGLLALALIYRLALRLTARPVESLIMTILFGLTRTVWIHNSIAEVYTFGLLILILLLALALWTQDIPRVTSFPARIYWLALLGGIGVAHHRIIALSIPALIYAVWPQLWANRRRLPVVAAISLLLGAAGFLPYIYLPLRAHAGADWVYGQPSTWHGFLDQFFGREADRFVGAPGSLHAIIDNMGAILHEIAADVTLLGLMVGLAGLLLALRSAQLRHPAIVLLLNGGVVFAFNAFYYEGILSPLILPVTISVIFGWLFLAVSSEKAAVDVGTRHALSLPSLLRGFLGTVAVFLLAAFLIARNYPFIHDLTTDPTGLDTIAQIEAAPPGSTVTLAWGPRYFAAAFAQQLQEKLTSITLVDNQADFASIVAGGNVILTPEYTFYNQPLDWWRARLGSEIYLTAAAPYLVRIDTHPLRAVTVPTPEQVVEGVGVAQESVSCAPGQVNLNVTWVAVSQPATDFSVFVHLLDSAGNVIAQGDQFAPVYGWRPLTTWTAGEAVNDVYPVTVPSESSIDSDMLIRYGLYHALPEGGFENVLVRELPVECE